MGESQRKRETKTPQTCEITQIPYLQTFPLYRSTIFPHNGLDLSLPMNGARLVLQERPGAAVDGAVSHMLLAIRFPRAVRDLLGPAITFEPFRAVVSGFACSCHLCCLVLLAVSELKNFFFDVSWLDAVMVVALDCLGKDIFE